MSVINISNLTFAYPGGENLFDNVSFNMDTDWKLGFIGRNGRGKTSFLKILTGAYEYGGKISSSVSFSYFPFEIKNKNMNAFQIASELCGNHEKWRLEKELALLEVKEEAAELPFRLLSGGEQTKILLACLFIKENNFLLIDEPTNHLDYKAKEAVRNYLAAKKGFILVSHDRMFLDACVDHILSINKTNIEIQKGNFSSWLRNKEQQDNFEKSANENLKKDIKQLKEAARRVSNWSNKTEKEKSVRSSGSKPDKGYVGHKAAKLMKRSKNIEKRRENAMEEKTKLLQNIETAENLSVKSTVYHSERLVELSEVSIVYGDKAACKNVSFQLFRGSKICLKGKNGSGKSSLLKLIAGAEKIPYFGYFYSASGLIISYLPQDASFLKGSLKDLIYRQGIDESFFKALLRKLDFPRDLFDNDIETFSDGQKKKTLLAASICKEAHLYVWDEPLNFIDIQSRIQIEEAVLKSNAAFIFAEHDETFVNKIAGEIVYL